MKYRVRLTASAERDIETVLAWFVEQRAITAGNRWLANLLAKVDTLERYPTRCALAAESAELGKETRELLFGRAVRYRILFEVIGQDVQVLRIWHSSRDWLSEDDL